MQFANDRESMVWTLLVAGALAGGDDAPEKRADRAIESFRKRDKERAEREEDRYNDRS